jgi:hypothetical protein
MSVVYAPELFVDREPEQQLVCDFAQQICAGHTPPTRTIIFRGARGLGKSWLALHLTRTVLPSITGVTPLLLSFAPRPTALAIQPREWFVDMAGTANLDLIGEAASQWATDTISTIAPFPSDADKQVLPVVDEVAGKSQSSALVLVLDSVFEADQRVLANIERQLLAPLAALPHVLIVLIGRGPPYPWESPDLRVNIIERRLFPFSVPQTHEQLQRLARRRIIHTAAARQPAKIVRQSGGFPLNNILIAQNQRLGMVVEHLLAVVGANDRPVIQQYLEALCVLDGFRDEHMLPLLEVRLAAVEGLPSNVRVRDVREKLVSTFLVRWERQVFRIDESIRQVLESYLEEERPVLWCRLHQRAYRMYHDIAIWTRSNDYYRKRAERHRNRLGSDPESLNCDQYGLRTNAVPSPSS